MRLELDMARQERLYVLFSRKPAPAAPPASGLTLGSCAEAPLHVTVTKDVEVSSRHAMLVLQRGAARKGSSGDRSESVSASIQDLGSLNGTVVADSLAAYERRSLAAVLRGPTKGAPSGVHALAPLDSVLVIGVSLFQLQCYEGASSEDIKDAAAAKPQQGEAPAAPIAKRASSSSSSRRDTAGGGVLTKGAAATARASAAAKETKAVALDITDDEEEEIRVEEAPPPPRGSGGGQGADELAAATSSGAAAKRAKPVAPPMPSVSSTRSAKRKAAAAAEADAIVCLDEEEEEEPAGAAAGSGSTSSSKATGKALVRPVPGPAAAAEPVKLTRKRGRPPSTGAAAVSLLPLLDLGPSCDACGTALLLSEALAAAAVLAATPEPPHGSTEEASLAASFDATAALQCLDAAAAQLQLARGRLAALAARQQRKASPASSSGSSGAGTSIDAFQSLLEGARSASKAGSRGGGRAGSPGAGRKKGAKASSGGEGEAAGLPSAPQPKLSKQERLEALARIAAAAAPAGWLSLEAPGRAKKRRKTEEGAAAAEAAAHSGDGFRWHDGSTVSAGELLSRLFPPRSSSSNDDGGEGEPRPLAAAGVPASRLAALYGSIGAAAASTKETLSKDDDNCNGTDDEDAAAVPTTARSRTLWAMTAVPAAAAVAGKAVRSSSSAGEGDDLTSAAAATAASPPRPPAAIVRMLSPSSVYLPVAMPATTRGKSRKQEQEDVFDVGILPRPSAAVQAPIVVSSAAGLPPTEGVQEAPAAGAAEMLAAAAPAEAGGSASMEAVSGPLVGTAATNQQPGQPMVVCEDAPTQPEVVEEGEVGEDEGVAAASQGTASLPPLSQL